MPSRTERRGQRATARRRGGPAGEAYLLSSARYPSFPPTQEHKVASAAAHLTYDLLLTKEGRQNCSVFITLLWMPMCWGVLFGSIPWIEETWEMVQDGLTLKYGPDYDYGDEYIHHHTDL